MNTKTTALFMATAIAAVQCLGATSRDAAALQRELEELRKQYETEHLQLEAYRLAFGNMQQGVGSLDAAAREKYLLGTIASTDRAAAELAIASSNFIDQVREAMKLNPLPPARAAQMSLRIEDLEKVILRTTAMP
ncbi:MAG: hypothetical protein MJ025_05440 [Victivallaceae bacterium]|nr:hypothetical protein [Victivallaceae bacterium]